MFNYLKQFVGKHDSPNDFYPISRKEIGDAEQRLGYSFPSQLKQFFKEIGCGFLKVGTRDGEPRRSLVNRVLSPRGIADLLLVPDDPWRPSEGFDDGVLPFFDCGENTYLILKNLSNTTNAVYWPSGLEEQRIASSLEEFFSRLYEHADFYLQDIREKTSNL